MKKVILISALLALICAGTNMAQEKKLLTAEESFDANDSDGVLVIHNGQIVYERYGGCLDETHPVAGSAANDPTSLPAYRAVADLFDDEEITSMKNRSRFRTGLWSAAGTAALEFQKMWPNRSAKGRLTERSFAE